MTKNIDIYLLQKIFQTLWVSNLLINAAKHISRFRDCVFT